MAILKEEGLSGLIGPIVCYVSRGQKIFRTRPGKPSKRAKPRKENRIFGLVSTYGSPMTRELGNGLLFPIRLETFNLVRGWMRNQYAAHHEAATWPVTIKKTGVCPLHKEADLRDFFVADLGITDNGNGNLSVHLPALSPVQEMNVPPDTVKVNIKLVAVASPFAYANRNNGYAMAEQLIDYKDEIMPAATLELNTGAESGDMVMVVLALEFITRRSGGKCLEEKRFLPASAVAMGKLV